jgi:hypothetical protein
MYWLRWEFRQAEADLLRARPRLGEGHLFDAILDKSRQYFIVWQISIERRVPKIQAKKDHVCT